MKTGFYAGSFNPFHQGHWDIYQQAKKQFDFVILGIGKNPEKYFNPKNDSIPVSKLDLVHYYDDLLSNTLKNYSKTTDITLIRGLRNIYDLNAEQNMLAFVRSMYPELKVVYFMSDPKYQHISSSALRDIKRFSEEEYEKYLVPCKEQNRFTSAHLEQGCGLDMMKL